jgi:MinD superfamily P-loop ATPase
MRKYDFIKVDEDVECPVCGQLLDGYETKEGPGSYILLDFRDVDKFCSRCGMCNTLIEFELNQGEEVKSRKELTISSYKNNKVIY